MIHPRAFCFRLVPGVACDRCLEGDNIAFVKSGRINCETDLVPGFLIRDCGPGLAESYKVSVAFAQKLKLTRSQISPAWHLKHHCRLVPSVNIPPPSFAHSVPWSAPSPPLPTQVSPLLQNPKALSPNTLSPEWPGLAETKDCLVFF